MKSIGIAFAALAIALLPAAQAQLPSPAQESQQSETSAKSADRHLGQRDDVWPDLAWRAHRSTHWLKVEGHCCPAVFSLAP